MAMTLDEKGAGTAALGPSTAVAAHEIRLEPRTRVAAPR